MNSRLLTEEMNFQCNKNIVMKKKTYKKLKFV